MIELANLKLVHENCGGTVTPYLDINNCITGKCEKCGYELLYLNLEFRVGFAIYNKDQVFTGELE